MTFLGEIANVAHHPDPAAWSTGLIRDASSLFNRLVARVTTASTALDLSAGALTVPPWCAQWNCQIFAKVRFPCYRVFALRRFLLKVPLCVLVQALAEHWSLAWPANVPVAADNATPAVLLDVFVATTLTCDSLHEILGTDGG
jgi:hypothetical protein